MEKIEKHIGVVNWFRDQAKNANYGFIHHVTLGDLFFHENGISQGQDINSFKENEIVIFTPQESKKYKEKIEASQVILLSNEIDLNFLFNTFIIFLKDGKKHSELDNIQKAVYLRTKNLIKEADLLTNNKFYIEYTKFCLRQLQPNLSIDLIKYYFSICKDIFPDEYKEFSMAMEPNISVGIAHTLWLNEYIETCQVDYIASSIISANKTTQQLIFNHCQREDKLRIFREIEKHEIVGKSLKIDKIKIILDLFKQFAGDLYEEILNTILGNCSTYCKLLLWLEEYHQELHFNDYKMFTVALSTENQKRFVKKTLQYIHEKKTEITLEDFTSIITVDYQTSKSTEISDGMKLDYSTSIILTTILELSNKTKIDTYKNRKETQYKIFDLILNQITNPADILEIKGYFDECAGICYVEENKIEDGKSSLEYSRNTRQKPHPICDGRKFVKDGVPVLCEKYNIEYWWCANQKCYKPSRTPHLSSEWEKYTLLDFLTILKVEFVEQDLEIYLNIINKTNRFLKHLKCRVCDNILRPVGKSNFAFYGVNNFVCTHEGCQENGKQIYLTHCLNGKCEHEIDSRDSVKCKNGWYICNYCHSCCSTSQIHSRIINLERRGQTYSGNKNGHRDLGLILCNKCGNEMNPNKVNTEEFHEVLNWFIENKNNSNYIGKYGLNKTNKNWFIFVRHDQTWEEFRLKLNYYLNLGFEIPNLDKNISKQLISEPIDFAKQNTNLLACKSCGNVLNLLIDPEREKAVKYFHNQIFFPRDREHHADTSNL